MNIRDSKQRFSLRHCFHVGIAMILTSSALASEVEPFPTRLLLNVGYQTNAIALADINNDGAMDMAIPSGVNTITAYLGDGAGGFVASETVTVGMHPRAVMVGDVNLDEKPDFVVVNTSGDSVSLLIGDGIGGFSSNTELPVGNSPIDLEIADIDSDADPDLIVANQLGGGVSVLRGDGNGGFQSQESYVAGHDLRSLSVLDIDGDGHTDVAVVANATGEVNLLMNDGIGGLIDGEKLSVANPVALDVDISMGQMRLAVSGSSGVTLFERDAQGVFNASATLEAPVLGSVLFASINDDGYTDIVAASDGDIRIWLGSEQGRFFSAPALPIQEPGLTGIMLADVVGDARDDLVFVTRGSPAVLALEGNGALFRSRMNVLETFNGTSMDLVDVSGDGILDIVTTSQLPGRIGVALGEGSGLFSEATEYEVGAYVHPVEVCVKDLNGDGEPDLVSANHDADSISILLNAGDGVFYSPVEYDVGAEPRFVAAADVTGDGKFDLLVANYADNTVSLLVGNGSGGFALPVNLAVDQQPMMVASGEVNGDGYVDIVTGNDYSDTISVLLGDGAGGFATAVNHFGGGPVALIQDVNADGIDDVIAAGDRVNYSEDFVPGAGVAIFISNGDGGLSIPQGYAVDAEPVAMSFVDVSGDGMPDILTVNNENRRNGLTVLFGEGDGRFEKKMDFGTGQFPLDFGVGDVTGDGIKDVVALTNPPSDGGAYGEPGWVTVLPAPSGIPQASDILLMTNEYEIVDGVFHAVADQELRFEVVAQPEHALVYFNEPMTGAFQYAPVSGFLGNDTFAYVATDGAIYSNLAFVTVDVNGRPVASEAEVTANVDGIVNGTLVATDPEQDELQFYIVTSPLKGSVTVLDAATGSYNYVANAGFEGLDVFTFAVTDSRANSIAASVSVTVPGSSDLDPDGDDEGVGNDDSGGDDNGEPGGDEDSPEPPIDQRGTDSGGGGVDPVLLVIALLLLIGASRRPRCMASFKSSWRS